MIELQDVSKAYGNRLFSTGFAMSLPPVRLLRSPGPSGIGKTTLLQVIAGLLPIEKGQIVMDGQVTIPRTRSCIPHCAGSDLFSSFQPSGPI